MRFKVKDMDIATGGILVAVMNEIDALKMDLYHEDRIVLRHRKKEATALLDIAESTKAVPPGTIGLFEEVLDALKAKEGDVVDVEIAKKPITVSFIRKKLDGKELTPRQIDAIIKDLVENKLSQIELTYFISACYAKGMSRNETVELTRAIVKHGNKLKLKRYPIADKHCTGGVPGNRTTMLIVPIVAAAGFTIPKTSSRSITSPAGTADTMEVLAPVTLSIGKIKKVVEKTNGCIAWGGGVDIAAADDKLIRLRHPLALDPEGMLLASILAKKAAVGATHVLIDIPLGRDTKIKTRHRANHLREEFIRLGERLNMHIHTIITDGRQPIGNGIGPVLEARDVLWILRRDPRRPLDLERKAVYMASEIFKLLGTRNPKRKAIELLRSGEAYRKMREIIEAQGGDPNIDPDRLDPGRFSYTLYAPKTGIVTDINNFTINKIARLAGAPKDKEAGIYLYTRERKRIHKGEPILTVYAKNKQRLSFALEILQKIGGIAIDSKGITA